MVYPSMDCTQYNPKSDLVPYKGRPHPVLKIGHRQLPLAPAFAITSHAAEGHALKEGAIMDLCFGRGATPLGSCVAMTRVTHRDKMLIHNPFGRDLSAQSYR